MKHVLIVDDNRAIRETLADALEAEGYSVSLASGGPEALAAVARAMPSIVLLDLMLPGADGASVAQSLGAAGCTAPVVVVTADRTGAERARQIGALFLGKPFDLGALLDLIERVAR